MRILQNACYNSGVNLEPSSKIYIAPSTIANAGRGVFAKKHIKKNDVIERCPVVLVQEEEIPHLRNTELLNYYFMWGEDHHHHKAAICLGFGSMYNHSYTPNATYIKVIEDEYIDFMSLVPIKKGEEITINYNHGDPHNKSTLWIKSIPPAQ